MIGLSASKAVRYCIQIAAPSTHGKSTLIQADGYLLSCQRYNYHEQHTTIR